MRRIIGLIVTASLVVSLTGCGSLKSFVELQRNIIQLLEDDQELTEETTVTEAVSEQDLSEKEVEVDPDFKAVMDSYEEFFDSYVNFMKDYDESDDALSMLADYTDYMNKMIDAMEKLESIDADELSAEDYKYYIDVTGRITKKLLEINE